MLQEEEKKVTPPEKRETMKFDTIQVPVCPSQQHPAAAMMLVSAIQGFAYWQCSVCRGAGRTWS